MYPEDDDVKLLRSIHMGGGLRWSDEYLLALLAFTLYYDDRYGIAGLSGGMWKAAEQYAYGP